MAKDITLSKLDDPRARATQLAHCILHISIALSFAELPALLGKKVYHVR